MFKKSNNKKEKIEIDTSQLSEEEKEESGLKVRKGLLIFCIIVFVLIVVFSIIVANIKTN